MDSQKQRQVEYVFLAALEQTAANVGPYLEQACADDVELRAAVNRLLFHHINANGFLEAPIAHVDGQSGSVDIPHAWPGGDRFVRRRKLGEGGFGEVYEVVDRDLNTVVALKCLKEFDAEHLYRLKREFRTLADLGHQNLITVYELFSNSDPPFFTMELLTGDDLAEIFRERNEPPRQASEWHQTLRAYFAELAAGVAALHERQLIHRDIKPSNVFVENSGRVVLLDFGLAKHMGVPRLTTLAVAGTIDYIAPEQLNGEATAASDCYAVGVMLFEALTGDVPFTGPIGQRLSRKCNGAEPIRPSELARDVPPDLDELCWRLLQPVPADRPTAKEVSAALGAMRRTGQADTDRGRAVVSHVLLGRESESTALRAAFTRMQQGHTDCVHLHGPSGVGKTRIVRSFLDEVGVATPECVVLSGRCYESEAAPHKGLDELVDRLALYLNGVEPERARLLIPRQHFRWLVQLFPVLRRLEKLIRPGAEVADPTERRRLAFQCLRECLARIGASHPLILWLDDLQWCDSDTVSLLNDLVQKSDSFGCLILLSYRDTNLATNAALTALDRTSRLADDRPTVRLVPLENFSNEAAGRLASALLAQCSTLAEHPEAVDAIARESKGNPFFITELVRYAVAIPEAQDFSAGAFGIGHVIKRRASLLPDAALRLLELVAVAGQPLPSAVCARAARSGSEFQECRTMLSREHLLRTHGLTTSSPIATKGGALTDEREALDVYHDQVREAITESLTHEAIVVYHGLLAAAFEAAGSSDHERLSIHWEKAGHLDKAVEHARRAGTLAMEALAFDRAARAISRAIDLFDADDDSTLALYQQLGDALSYAGRGKEAAEAYLTAAARSESIGQFELRRKACEQYLRSGHIDEGTQLMRALLREVGLWYPEHPAAVVGSLLWQRCLLFFQMLRGVTTQDHAKPLIAEQMKLDMCWTFAVGMSMVDVVRGGDFQARYTRLALRGRQRSRVALGLAAELAMGRMDGGRSAGATERLFARALEESKDDSRSVAFAHAMKGVASWIAGDWTDCFERSSFAKRLFTEKCRGVEWELTTANTFALSALVFLGRWREHAQWFPELVRRAEALGDRHGAISLPLIAYTYVHSLSADRPADALAMIKEALARWPYREYQMQHCDALIAEVDTHLYLGHSGAAVEAIARDWTRVKRSHLLHIQIYRILMMSLRARANLALATADPGVRGPLLKSVRTDARSLMRFQPTWARALGSLLQAGISSLDGSNTRAVIGHLRDAERLFSATQMGHYLAAVRTTLVELDPSLSDVGEAAVLWKSTQGVVDIERLTRMLVPGSYSTR